MESGNKVNWIPGSRPGTPGSRPGTPTQIPIPGVPGPRSPPVAPDTPNFDDFRHPKGMQIHGTPWVGTRARP